VAKKKLMGALRMAMRRLLCIFLAESSVPLAQLNCLTKDYAKVSYFVFERGGNTHTHTK